jgi:hypothetical protein
MAAAKRSIVKKPRAIRATSLAAATTASVKAVLKKAQLAGGGTTIGILLEQASMAARGVDADQIAKDITAGVAAATGVKLKPTSTVAGGSILVGFAPPNTLLKPLA